jgi:heparosan-N-sulfate-glucuronate 5-epimerase
MNKQPERQSIWHSLPLIGFIITEWQTLHAEQTRACYSLAPMSLGTSKMPPYPVDMWPLLSLPLGTLDETGVPYYTLNDFPNGYYATMIAQYALAQWNVYLKTGEEESKKAFMTQAEWLVAHESRVSHDAGGWPFPLPSRDYFAAAPWLSALIQGNAISVLVRAYILTGEDIFLQVARRAVRTFELDIHNGGVSTSIDNDGIFFEEVAVYPAAHILNGYIFSLFGLYDYVSVTSDTRIARLIDRSLAAMHVIIDAYDLGYWSSYDFLYKSPAPRFYHDQHSVLLVALSRYSGCEHCRKLSARWAEYQTRPSCRLRYFIVSRFVRYRRGFQHEGMRGAFFRIFRPKSAPQMRIIHERT